MDRIIKLFGLQIYNLCPTDNVVTLDLKLNSKQTRGRIKVNFGEQNLLDIHVECRFCKLQNHVEQPCTQWWHQALQRE